MSVKVNHNYFTVPTKFQIYHSRIIVLIGEDRHDLNYLGSYKLKEKKPQQNVVMLVALPDGKI